MLGVCAVGVEQPLVNTVMNSQVPYEAGYALTL
jgi:hypothetical protein